MYDFLRLSSRIGVHGILHIRDLQMNEEVTHLILFKEISNVEIYIPLLIYIQSFDLEKSSKFSDQPGDLLLVRRRKISGI